jgi:hypothetical protein
MKRIHLVYLSLAIIFEGFTANYLLWQMQFDSNRGQIFNYATMRMILTALSGAGLVILIGWLLALFRSEKFSQKFTGFLDDKLINRKPGLFFMQGALVILGVFLAECFILTYAAIPVPMRPILAWAVLICFNVWLLFRMVYACEYRQRPALVARLRDKWNKWLPIQRTTFIVLALMGLVYFIGFMPSNYQLDANGRFFIHGDEAVIYPDIARSLVWQGNFTEMVNQNIWDWQWWYGYPYLPISAAVLVLPRLLFGSGFATNTQLNIFLLRQFISVLPMVLALMLLVYLVNRFKSLWQSVILFTYMALVPGVVKFGYHFWHPDSIIILLILLTFYFLEKDRLRFGKFFYFAAVTCGLATAIKLFGVFFVLAIAGYLLAGLWQKQLTFKKAVLSGLGFILAMAGTILITSPGLIIPAVQQFALKLWFTQQNSLLTGYNEPDPMGVYKTGLLNWLYYFGLYFMKPFFFFFSFMTLLAGSLWGSRKYLSRLILAWSIPATYFLVTFSAMKSFQYMFPVMIPLFLGALLFFSLANGKPGLTGIAFLDKSWVRKSIWAVTGLLFLIQFVININILFTSPWMGF